MMRITLKFIYGLMLTLSFAICAPVVQAQNARVKIITCENIDIADTTSQEETPINPRKEFRLIKGEENVSFVIRFSPFNEFTMLKLIVTRDSANEEYVNSRRIPVPVNDTTASTNMMIKEPGKYVVKVVNSSNENEVLGRSGFSVLAEQWSIWDYWSFAVIALLLALLSFIEWFHPRLFVAYRDWFRKPISLTFSLTSLVIAVAVILEKGTHNYLQNSNLIGILGLIGIFGTIIGVILTYEQLKLAEDRIEGYEKFYDVLHEILSDPKAQFLQFYGSTIVPGQVSFGDDQLLEIYINDLNTIATHFRGQRDKVTIIVPSTQQYVTAYKPYVGKIYNNKEYDQQTIDRKVEEALEVQKSLGPRANVIEVNKWEEIGIIDAFYYSNGRTAVYAVPLHYNVARIEDLEHSRNRHDPKPILIGFKTTNSSIVGAFKANFEQLLAKLKPADGNPTGTNS